MHWDCELIRELPPFWQSQICSGFEPAVCDEVKNELLINNKTSCMKTSHSFGIEFIVRKQKNENAQGLLYARITVDGKVTEASLKETIDFKVWDKRGESVIGKTIYAKTINEYIESKVEPESTDLCTRILRLSSHLQSFSGFDKLLV